MSIKSSQPYHILSVKSVSIKVSLYEAVNRLSGELVDIYEDLKDDKKNLGVLPRKWLAFLEEAIESR